MSTRVKPVLIVFGILFWMSISASLMDANAANATTYPAAQLITSQPSQITLSRPAYLQPTSLPGLGTSIIRISDAATFGSGQRYYRHYYSKQQPWNSDGTKLILSHNSSRVYFLDGRTFAYQWTAINVPEYPKWSNSNPDLMFGVSGVTFVKYTPSTGTKQTLKTFPEFSQMWLGVGEGNLSNDDRYAPLVGETSTGRTVVIYDTVNNVEVSRKSFSGSGMDWASMSPSGQYVVVNNATYEVYDRNMNFLRSLNVYAGGHADMGYDTAGNEVMVSAHFEGGRGVITTTTRLATNVVREELPGSGQPAGIYQASNYHISCRNINRPGYCYISNFAFGSAQNASMYREVFALRLDGSGTVERFSQDFAAPLPLADEDYSRASMVVPNRDGSLVLFSSDWGDASSDAIIYDYVAGVQLLGPAKFIPGDRVQITSGPLNVRSCASTSCTVLGTQGTGVLGTVVSGGQFADGYYWWNINYDSGADGWSEEDSLAKEVALQRPTNLRVVQP